MGNSEKEFEKLFNEYWERLYLYTYRIIGNKEAAEDIVQNVFVTLWNKKSQDIENIRSYLFGAIRFQISKYLRDKKAFSSIEDLFESFLLSDDSASKLEMMDLFPIVEKCIQKLPEKCRQAFIYSRIDCLSNKEIASKMQISLSTTENHINKALKILRADLKRYSYLVAILFLIS